MDYDEPLSDSEIALIAQALFGFSFNECGVDVLDDPLSAEFVLDDILDAEEIG